VREPGAHGGPSQDAFCTFSLGQRDADPTRDVEGGEAGFKVEATVSGGKVISGKITLTAG